MSIILNPIQREYQNPNLWEMAFVDPDSEAVHFLIQNTTLPFEKFDTETRSTGTKHIKSVEFVDEFSIEFNETENLDVINYLTDWQNLIYDSKTRTFRVGRHTKDAVFFIQKYGPISDTRLAGAVPPTFALAGAYETTRAYLFKNLLFKGIDNIDWAYGEEGNKKVTGQFTVDEIQIL